MILTPTGHCLPLVSTANIIFLAVLYIVSPLLPCLSPQPTAYVESTQVTQWEPSATSVGGSSARYVVVEVGLPHSEHLPETFPVRL